MNTQTIYGVSGLGDVGNGAGEPPPAASREPAALEALPTSQDRLAALIAHGGTWFAWMLAPLVVYLLKRGESRYAEFHALQSLLWSLLGTVLAATTCGLAIPVFMVFHAIAAWKTLHGEPYEYPFVGQVARNIMA